VQNFTQIFWTAQDASMAVKPNVGQFSSFFFFFFFFFWRIVGFGY
jgi:hypothetical protein